MQFVITARDGANMLERRMRVRPRHLENLAKVQDHVLCAGGLLDDAGNPIGSALILEFADREQLDEYLRGEPYILEKVWEKVDVAPMNMVIMNGEKVGK